MKLVHVYLYCDWKNSFEGWIWNFPMIDRKSLNRNFENYVILIATELF